MELCINSNIQDLITKFAGIGDELKGIKLWDEILKYVIILPSVDDEIINRLKYCLNILKWIEFAMDMTHIESFNNLIIFCKNQLDEINASIRTQTIEIKCIKLIEEQWKQFETLVNHCQYQSIFNLDALKAMINKFTEWQQLQAYLDVFLKKYTQPNDTVRQQTADIVTFLNNWDSESYRSVSNREEWQELEKYSETLKFVGTTSSQIFRKMWFHGRNDIKDEWNLDHYMNTLYPLVKNQWDTIIQKIKTDKLKIGDIEWFQNIDNINTELCALGFDNDLIKKVINDISDSKGLINFKYFVQDLSQMVDVFVQCGVKITTFDRKYCEFKRYVQKTKDINHETEIKVAANLYRKLKEILIKPFNDLQKQWIKTTVECQKSVHTILTSDEFQGEYFRETLQLLTDSGSNEYVELSGALDKVQKQYTNTLQKSFKTEIELASYFTTLEIRQNDINDVLQVDNALPDIKQIVKDAGQHAKVRDKQRLDTAMNDKNSYFRFKTQNELKELIANSVYDNKSVTEIGRDALILEYTTTNNKLIKYTCNDIENMIDIILLSKGSNIDEYIQKLDICKEISELRIKYIICGGRVKHHKDIQKFDQIKATLKRKHDQEQKSNHDDDDDECLTFEIIRNKWKYRMEEWMDDVEMKRNDEQSSTFAHIFNYFTINTIRIIIDKLNKYIRSDNHNHNQTNQLFQELLCYFQFINRDLTKQVLLDHICKWIFIESSFDASFTRFKQCFNTKYIVNKSSIQYNDMRKYINYGQPNLLIEENKKNALFSSLKLYMKNQNNMQIVAYQYLICNKTTLVEDIDIFLNRCLQNKYRHNSLTGYPLYCLMFPEDLNISVADKITEIITNKLLINNQDNTRNYALLIISCDNINPLSNLLQHYKISKYNNRDNIMQIYK